MFLHLNKDFNNFHKRGQRLIAGRIKGPNQGLSVMLTFFSEIPTYVHAQKNILPPLMGLPTWIGISWKWANMLTELGMVNVGWICSMQSEIFLQMKFIIFKVVPPNRLHFYLDSPLHRISSLFSNLCLFRKAILQKKFKAKVLKF